MWVEIQIEAGAEAAELLAAEISPVTGGVEIRDAGTLLATAADRSVVVALCAPGDVDNVLSVADECLTLARAGGASVDPVVIRQRPAHEDEWRDVWKQFFRATRIGRRFIVRPSWDPGQIQDGEHVIDLDPGRAFGTGAHSTTRLVIALAEGCKDDGLQVARFLDLGCGSGILAIAAARLWRQAQGVAVDNDTEATDCTTENLERNNVTGVRVVPGTLSDASGPFDLIMANIQADVLTLLAPTFPAVLAPGGRLILSGLLQGDVPAIVARYQSVGLTLLHRQNDDEWAGLLMALS